MAEVLGAIGVGAFQGVSLVLGLQLLALARRMRIGMGDPLVANRLLVWGVGTGAIAAVAAIHLAGQLLGHYELPASLIGVVSLLVLVTAVAEWLAFFPPRAWRDPFAPAIP